MHEISIDDLDTIMGGMNWASAGNACIAFGGAAVLIGQPEIGAVLGIAGIICHCLA